jgi:2-methylisocitrate lyase-like PEP mutase family enzyme
VWKDLLMTNADTFRALHRSGCFVMPNPFDVGSAKLLEALGFPALATTSAGLAATLGRDDMQVTRDELVAHVAAITAAIDLPLNVDSERCFAETADGIAETVNLLADAGAAGFSIEDWNPATNAIDDADTATERVRAAATAAKERGLVLTARCENHLHGIDNFDDTLSRLRQYIAAGAEVVYAPMLWSAEHLGAVAALGAPVNALLLPGGPDVSKLAARGVRRVSVGGSLAKIAMGAMVASAEHLLAQGTIDTGAPFLDGSLQQRAFNKS